MKKPASVVCMMALAWYVPVRPSFAHETDPPLNADERPSHVAVAEVGREVELASARPVGQGQRNSFDLTLDLRKVHLVFGTNEIARYARSYDTAQTIAHAGPVARRSRLPSQGGNRISRRQDKIALAAAIGFGVGFGSGYFAYKDGGFDRYEQEKAAAMGMLSGALAALITSLALK